MKNIASIRSFSISVALIAAATIAMLGAATAQDHIGLSTVNTQTVGMAFPLTVTLEGLQDGSQDKSFQGCAAFTLSASAAGLTVSPLAIAIPNSDNGIVTPQVTVNGKLTTPMDVYLTVAVNQGGKFSPAAGGTPESCAGGTPLQLQSTNQFELDATSPGYNGGEVFQVDIGATETFGANANPAGKLFLSAYWESGLGQKDGSYFNNTDALGSPWRSWLSATMYSTAAAANNYLTAETLAGIYTGSGTGSSTTSTGCDSAASSNTAANASSLACTNLNQIAESAEIRGGGAYRFNTSHLKVGIPRSGQSLTASEIVTGIGITTPVSSGTATNPPEVFCNPLSDCSGPAVVTDTSTNDNGKCTAGLPCSVLNPSIRNRAFFLWETGLRFQTFYQSQDKDPVDPTTIDLTAGQNEAVTGGHLHGFVFHFGAAMPLWSAMDFIHLIFSADVAAPGHGNGFAPVSNQILLSPSPSPAAGPGFTQLLAPLPGGDSVRLGIAVDVVDFLKNHLSLKTPPAGSSTNPASH